MKLKSALLLLCALALFNIAVHHHVETMRTATPKDGGVHERSKNYTKEPNSK